MKYINFALDPQEEDAYNKVVKPRESAKKLFLRLIGYKPKQA